ncbi:MerR family transcriptional regulator [Priestia megaterium]|uniref:MerR family transcriptional regulator n=1 Tax=Priestia megaterium TaxID=1404 RepID=UPI001BE84AF5|nr:MerR family transcriptional regulator [Priestia megaterium]MBT2259379.1 MerR family transcriptional regulator [Priestia megaterium]MBT2281216.1 MerR family transcriptional regulator [Priestia megaterium]
MYRIGELANLANVTKRTIDHYTNIGLLKPERSASNYRYYTEEALKQVRLIEEYKKQDLSLKDIKLLLQDGTSSSSQEDHLLSETDEVLKQIKELNMNLEHVLPLIEKLNDQDKKLLRSRLSSKSVSLMHSLLMLLS